MGSATHLKRQADYISGAKDSHYTMDSRTTDFSMKQKVRGNTTMLQLSLIGSEGKVRGLDNNRNESKISLIGMRFPAWQGLLKPASSRNGISDKPKKQLIDVNLLKKKNYNELDYNNNTFKFGTQVIALKKTPIKPKKEIQKFTLPKRKPLRRVDPRLLVRKKPKLRQKPKEYEPEKAPEYDKTEIKELNFVVEKTKLEKYERKKVVVKKVKRERYVKEQLRKYKPEEKKEKKKKEPPAPVKVPWKRLEPKKEVVKEAPAPKVFKVKAKAQVQVKPKRFIKFEVKTSRKEEYDDEITLLTPKQEALKFKGKGEQIATFTINLNRRPNKANSLGNINCESIDVYKTIKI